MRLSLVQFARVNGVKPAARAFGCQPKTVRKWLARFDGTLDSLAERSRAPKHHPRRISKEDESKIIRAAHRLPTWGSRRLKRDCNLAYSPKTIARVRRERGLARKWKRKKHETKRYLREVKRDWRAFQQIDIDTKHLVDIPEYWPQIQDLDLPPWQYTARDVSTGALFIAFAEERSLACAELFAAKIIEHLEMCRVSLAQTTWQSDNGSEFIGSWQAKDDSAFTKTIEATPGQTHRTIPPGQHRFQADVETVHEIMEKEFYMIEKFKDRSDFIQKAQEYLYYFNIARTNSAKENKTPWQLLKEKFENPHPCIPAFRVYYLDLLHENLLHKSSSGGYDVGVLP